MKIEYTYREPDDRPIEQAEFEANGANCKVDVRGDKVTFAILKDCGLDYRSSVFSPADWHDFAVLANLIDRQLGGGR